MILNLDTERLRTLAEVRAFLDGSDLVDFRLADRDDTYAFVRRTLVRFRYPELDKPAKGLLRRFLGKVTGLSRAQLTRLIGQYRATGRIEDRRRGPTRPFERRYTAADVRQLAEVDEILGGLCGAATRRVMQRQFDIFGDPRYERLAGLSNGHLYRLRGSTTYRRRRTSLAKTRPVRIAIGERRKPHPGGRPGFLRVDSVHQGDLDGEKGVYLINIVDEVTQYEFVGAIEAISEAFLQAQRAQKLRCSTPTLGGFYWDIGRWHFDVFARCGPLKEEGRLDHQANVLPTYGSEFVEVQACDIDPGETVRAPRRLIEAAKDVDQRGLPGSRRADYANKLASLDP